MIWVATRDSLWLVPGLITTLCGAAAVLLVQLEKHGRIVVGHPEHWLLGDGAEGARGVLSAIAGGLITVTGVVFSVTIVALQLASSQFTPRVLRNFTSDRSNQLVLGIFIGTFTYTLLVLRTVRSATPGEEEFVPRLAVAVAMLLVLLSIAFLIYFIHHAARSIQIPVILDRVTRITLNQVERLFPESVGSADPTEEAASDGPVGEGRGVLARTAGYLQAVDEGALFDLGERHRLVIQMERHIGEFVLPGQILATVWPADVDEGVGDAVRRALVLGAERTPEQDVEFGIIELSDIAVKALSPGINDPTTALHCIDRLGQILLAFGTRSPPRQPRSREGRVHFIALPLTFDRVVDLAFGQIRHFGAANPAIAKKLLDLLTSLLEMVPQRQHAALMAQRDRVLEAARDEVASETDRAAVEGVSERPHARSTRSRSGH